MAIGVGLLGGIWLVSHKNKPTASQAPTQPNSVPHNHELTNGANQFAFNLFKQLLQPDYHARQKPPTIVQNQSPNLVISPLGVQFVLTLLLNGATGQTYDEIARALGFQHASLDEINQFHLSLQQRLRRWQAESKLVLANSSWIRPWDSLHPDFERVGKAFYALEAYKVDFRNPVEVARRINAWGKQKTQGFIPQVVQPREIDPETTVAIVNALYLRALWQQPFKVADYEMDFFVEAGRSVRVRPMEGELEEVPYMRTEECEIVGLPYRGGDWLCYVVLPRSGLRVEELVAGLDAARWQEWLNQMRPQRVQLVMPRFEVESEYDLIPALERLGIQRAFGADAEFPRILVSGDAGYIYLFKQVSRVRVDERGTEAGAVTVAMEMLGVVMQVDRPFLFVIADRSSGTVLFMGIVRQPAG